jgi:Arc-like DNA binding domain
MSEKIIKLNLRLPAAVHAKVRIRAEKNNVSLNTEIVNTLMRAGTEGIEEIVRPMLAALREDIARDVRLLIGTPTIHGEELEMIRAEKSRAKELVGSGLLSTTFRKQR